MERIATIDGKTYWIDEHHEVIEIDEDIEEDDEDNSQFVRIKGELFDKQFIAADGTVFFYEYAGTFQERIMMIQSGARTVLSESRSETVVLIKDLHNDNIRLIQERRALSDEVDSLINEKTELLNHIAVLQAKLDAVGDLTASAARRPQRGGNDG